MSDPYDGPDGYGHGSLPPEIYRRRRILAIVVAALVAVLIFIGGILVFGGGDDKTTPTSSSSSLAPSGVIRSGTASADAPPADQSTPPSSDRATTDPATTGPEASDPSVPATSSSLPPATNVEDGAVCPDSALAVTVTADKATYTIGEEPVFTAVVTNATASACTRDVGAAMQEVQVLSLDGTQRIWSNFDCSFEAGTKNESLAPGEQISYALRWAGKDSQPGCPGSNAARVVVPAGQYRVIAFLGTRASEPVTFNIVAPQ